MKIFDIALKDLLRSYRSAFLLSMMFVAPLVITGIIFAAFGGMIGGQGSFNIPVTRVVVANLDQPDTRSGLAAGKTLSDHLASPDLSRMMSVTAVPDEASALAAVNDRQADVAVIIPSNYTKAVGTQGTAATVRLYQDPTLSVGPGIVKSVVGQFVDGFAGAKIAVQVTNQQMAAHGLALTDGESEAIAQRYAAWVQSSGSGRSEGSTLVSSRAPASPAPVRDPVSSFLGPVMAGMLVLFVFFTGAAAAQSIITEDEEGTLARAFTTPTPRGVILGGKMAGILAILVVQVLVLLLVSSLLFQIRWGNAGTVTLSTVGLVIAASGFGVMLMSFIKTGRQAGPVLGAVTALMGLLGGLIPTGDPSQPSPFETISLALPQGWAMRAWRLSLTGANASDVLVPVIVLLLFGTVFFGVGTYFFRRRFE